MKYLTSSQSQTKRALSSLKFCQVVGKLCGSYLRWMEPLEGRHASETTVFCGAKRFSLRRKQWPVRNRTAQPKIARYCESTTILEKWKKTSFKWHKKSSFPFSALVGNQSQTPTVQELSSVRVLSNLEPWQPTFLSWLKTQTANRNRAKILSHLPIGTIILNN